MAPNAPTDLFAQRVRCADYLEGEVRVRYGFCRHLGPRVSRAEVEITYSGQYPLEFISRVEDWPSGADYTAAIRRGILDALHERGERSIGGKFTLESVAVDPVESSTSAFSIASREATASILRLLQRRPKG